MRPERGHKVPLEFLRFRPSFFGKSPVGQSGRFRRRKRQKTSRLHTFITFMRPYALRMQPYAVRMHFFDSSKKPTKSSAERTSKKPYALYAPLLGVGVFSAFFLLRELHTVHTAAYGSHRNPALALLPVGIGASSARENRKCIRRCIRLSGQKAPIDPLLSERRDSFGMASEPMDGIRPCGPLQGPFRGLPAVRRIGTVPAAKGCRRGPGAPDA